MANMCSNHLFLKGGKTASFVAEMERISIEQQTDESGQFAFGIGEDPMFDVRIVQTNEIIYFETKWRENIDDLVKIAKLKEFQFELGSEELGNSIFTEYRFDGIELTERFLTSEKLAMVKYDEQKDCYLFNGEEIDSQSEQYEKMLADKPYLAVSNN